LHAHLRIPPNPNLGTEQTPRKSQQILESTREAESKESTHELNEGLVAVGADVAHGVDDPAEGLAELDELLFGALPRHVPQVKHLGRRLRVPELRRRPGRHLGPLGWPSLRRPREERRGWHR
jgi:hypothetical protein